MKRLTKRTTLKAVAGAVLAAAVAGLVVANVLVSQGRLGTERQLNQATAPRPVMGTLQQRFAILARRHTNKCSLASEELPNVLRGRIQGSCCEPMILTHYVQQTRGLQAYAAVGEIPPDPYDVSVRLARRLIAFNGSITLSPAQQSTYDQAAKLSDEHGPCCCHCWRWTAFEGQAKYLMTQQGYGPRRVATIWNLEDGCGGSSG